jgi:hypothetical protein
VPDDNPENHFPPWEVGFPFSLGTAHFEPLRETRAGIIFRAMESRKPRKNMPKLLSHSDYWRLQAQEARAWRRNGLRTPWPGQTCSRRRINMTGFAAWAVLRGPNFLIVRH